MNSRYAAVKDEESGYPLHDLVTPSSATERDDDTVQNSSPFPSSSRNGRDGRAESFVATEDSTEPLHSSKGSSESRPRGLLPPVDIGSSTKYQCLLTIALGIAFFLVCIICVIKYWPNSRGRNNILPVIKLHKAFSSEAFSFVVNLILTQVLEGLAYIHSISLRWALLKEDRLVFNTNIRLFTSSKLSVPNTWYFNTISASLLVLCYSATSMLIIPQIDSDYGTHDGTYVNLIALLALGIALFGQTCLAIWCYISNLRDIPTWSSNPLNTTVTMLNQGLVRRSEGRCMSGVQDSHISETEPQLPRAKQPSQWKINNTARYATIFAWILVGLSLIWWTTIILVTRTNMLGAIQTVKYANGDASINSTWYFSLSWSPSVNPDIKSVSTTNYFNAVFFSLDASQQGHGTAQLSFISSLIISLLFVCAIQGLQTLGLHCAELVVNLSRDEDVWRALSIQNTSKLNAKTHVLATPPFFAALWSWKYDLLLLFKSLLHWLLGQSIQPSFSDSNFNSSVWFSMNYARLFVYVICASVFAAFVTGIVFMKPRGPQPATYGHLQTVADVVDEWDLDDEGRFWWGDKGQGDRDGVRHAGMSARRDDLGTIHMDAFYSGKDSRILTGRSAVQKLR